MSRVGAGATLAYKQLKRQESSHCHTTVEPSPLTLKQHYCKTPAGEIKIHTPCSGSHEPQDDAGAHKGAGPFSYYQQNASVSLFPTKEMHLNLVKWAAWPRAGKFKEEKKFFPFQGGGGGEHVN